MRNIVLALTALAIAAMPANAVNTTRSEKGEAQLARLLAGRVAGKPVDCIYLHRITSSEIIDRTAIVYRVGSILYVNRPNGGADSLLRGDVLLTSTSLSQLCNVDIVRLLDQGSRFPRGFVNLGDFVPYVLPHARR